MKRAFVTGASGFVGAWLCRRLADLGVPVTAALRRPPDPAGLFARLGLGSDPLVTPLITPEPGVGELRAAAPDAVFHLAGLSQAAEARADPARAFEANARGTWRLLDAVKGAGVAAMTVIASTEAVYGPLSDRPATELDLPRPTGPYELSKLAAESAGLAFAAAGLPVTIARLGNLYGPGDPNGARIIPSLVAAVQAGTAPVLANPWSVRSYLAVEDGVEGLLALAQADPARITGQPFNIVASQAISTLDLAQLLLSVAGRPDLQPRLLVPRGGGDTSIRMSSNRLARDLLGWDERISLSNGLRGLLELETT